MADGTPARLGLNPTETEVYNKMTARERTTFNAQADDNAKTIFIRVLVERDRAWRERSDISQKLIYACLYVTALVALALLGLTKFKNNEETLKYFSLALNSMIFITEIIMLFNKLRWNNIVWYNNILICILIVLGLLLSILLPIFIKILPATISVFFTKVAVIFTLASKIADYESDKWAGMENQKSSVNTKATTVDEINIGPIGNTQSREESKSNVIIQDSPLFQSSRTLALTNMMSKRRMEGVENIGTQQMGSQLRCVKCSENLSLYLPPLGFLRTFSHPPPKPLKPLSARELAGI
ncbi:11817_t:CDS:2 [Rhizophagus irregularis]|nr:11817_t:CDS:2 [Rhizophagus irregularis]